MSRCAAPIFRTLLAAIAAFAIAALPVHARADQRASYSFQGDVITFARIVDMHGARAVSIDDPGVRQLLSALAATATWQPDQRYILVTTAQPQVISFALGDKRYDVGPVTLTAPFAPFVLDGNAFVPFDELLRALGLALKTQGSQQILQPQLTSLDVQPSGDGYKVIARGALPLDGRITVQNSGKVVILFDGVGSALSPSRTIDGAPVRQIDVASTGTASHPRTTVTLTLSRNAGSPLTGTDDQRDFTVAFNGAAAAVTQAPPAASGAPAQPQTHVTSVQTQNETGGFTVHIAVDAPASYDWHRLHPPDNRIWIDIHNARLAMPPSDSTVRVHQQNPTTVRVAFSLAAYQTIDVVPDDQGVSVTVGSDLADESAPRSGSGTTGQPGSAVAQSSSGPQSWKFTPRSSPLPESTYAPANPRLIVIDPGHGGSDPGTIRGDYQEKTIALDVSKRVRDILVKRGWQVVMTREDDRDVYAPNDSDRDELQARDDVANRKGARLFLSIHVNSFINSGPHGATVYYYKPEDYTLAQAVRRRIATGVPIKDDGVIKDKLYVLHHADMPSTLVEMAYLSNPDDRRLLASPQWRQSIAQAIADGVGDYAGPAPSGVGPSQ